MFFNFSQDLGIYYLLLLLLLFVCLFICLYNVVVIQWKFIIKKINK